MHNEMKEYSKNFKVANFKEIYVKRNLIDPKEVIHLENHTFKI
jgi:hypothetical protein